MKNLKVTDTILNTEELINSGLAEKWFDNFGMKHILNDRLKRMPDYGAWYYITEEDPKHNYGLDFNIYACYKVDGINFLKQLCTTSSITSYGLKRVFLNIPEITFSEETYDKGKENRKALKHASDCGWVFA